MKNLTIILLFLSGAAFAQVDSVQKVDNASVRSTIEAWTLANTFPDIIVFVQDGDGAWIVGEQVFLDPAYDKLGSFNSKEESLKAYLQSQSEKVPYKPPADSAKSQVSKFR